MHRTRGLGGRPGGQLFTEGLGALRKDCLRPHRCGLLRGLRLRGLVTSAPCVTCVNTGTLLIFPRTCNPMSQGWVHRDSTCFTHLHIFRGNWVDSCRGRRALHFCASITHRTYICSQYHRYFLFTKSINMLNFLGGTFFFRFGLANFLTFCHIRCVNQPSVVIF